jgi:hypothetical protein
MQHRPRFLAAGATTILVTALCAGGAALASTEAAWRIRPVRVVPQAPDAQLGTQVRIEGLMSFGGSSAEAWLPPSCGAIDFFCRTGSGVTPFWCTGGKGDCEALCQMAWRDIELAASRGECVAFPLRLWRPAEHVVKSLDSRFSEPNPFDPVMGVSIVPCQPEGPSDKRPDLSGTCTISASVDAGRAPTGGAGGASGAGGTSVPSGRGGAPGPSAGTSGLPDPTEPTVPSCAISLAGGSGGGASLILLAGMLMALPARLCGHRRRREQELARRER